MLWLYILMYGSVSQVLTTPLPGIESLSPACLSGVGDLYRQAVPEEFFQQLEKELNLSTRKRIFQLPLVVWMMTTQRLDGKATLSTAVQQIVELRPQSLLTDHKRIREKTVSSSTGAYSDARRAMPVKVAERVADRVLEHLLLPAAAKRCRVGIDACGYWTAPQRRCRTLRTWPRRILPQPISTGHRIGR